jgi:ABC-type sugar transport system substrate-binding protein
MRRRLITLTAMAALLVLSIVGPAQATKPGTDPSLIDGHKITICHVTNSATNPYVVITIDISAWHADGNEGHSSDHHINHKTGQHDQLWDADTGTCVDETSPTTTTTEPTSNT